MKKQRVIQIIREEIEKVVNEDKVTSTFNDILNNDLVDDRREYDIEDLESTYQLSNEDAKNLYIKIQKHIREDYKPSLRGYNVIDKSSGEIIDSNLPKHMALALAAKKNGWMIQSTDQLAEDEEINEMATFYKTKGDKGAAKAALKKAKEKYKVGTALYNTLDTLEKKGEIDYKALSKETGKDVASYNNPKSRGVLEKDLADFIEFEVGKRGRKADPNKPAKVKKEKGEKVSGKKKDQDMGYSTIDKTITTTKDTSTSDIKKAEKKIKAKAKRDSVPKIKKGTTGDKDALDLLDDHKAEMQKVAKEFKAAKEEGDKTKSDSLTSKLKDMTTKRKELQKAYEDSASDEGKDDELSNKD